MTLEELYAKIGGDYAQALRTLRLEKLIDKHIRKLPDNAIFSELVNAGKAMDATRIFESAHAIKGVSANLGLNNLSALAATICDEFREGRARTMTDAEVADKIDDLDTLFQMASKAIRAYESSL